MKNGQRKNIPEVEFRNELYCPHCGTRLYRWKDSAFAKCPHLVFGYASNYPSFFFAVRTSYAEAFLRNLMASPDYRKGVIEGEVEPISEEDEEIFCHGDFSPERDVWFRIVTYCSSDLPQDLFPELLSQSTVIFTAHGYYDSVHIAVDMGEECSQTVGNEKEPTPRV